MHGDMDDNVHPGHTLSLSAALIKAGKHFEQLILPGVSHAVLSESPYALRRLWDFLVVPMIVGHEFVGEIVETGSNVTGYEPGQIVSGEGHVVCGRCRNCMAGRRHMCADAKGIGVNRPGAFAEYLSLPAANVWVHDPKIDLDVASLFDPFGNAVHTALQFDVLGEDVLVVGAGPIGIMAAAVCRHG